MISRPARYSAAVAGSSGCAGCSRDAWSAQTAVSVMADLPVERNEARWRTRIRHRAGGLFVGDDRADPVAQARVAPDQPDGVEDEHHDEAHADPREPVIRLDRRRRAEQVVNGDADHDYGEG